MPSFWRPDVDLAGVDEPPRHPDDAALPALAPAPRAAFVEARLAVQSAMGVAAQTLTIGLIVTVVCREP